MSLPYRKIYIDTRYKTGDSKSNSDFYFELDQPLVCPQGTIFYMSSISIPHSWTTIEPSLNSRLYFFIFNKTNNDNASFIVYLSDGNYIGTDFATEIKAKMNAAAGSYYAPLSNLFNVVYDIKTNTIQILITDNRIAFYILTPKD